MDPTKNPPTPKDMTNSVLAFDRPFPNWILAPNDVQYYRPTITNGKLKTVTNSIGSFSVPFLSGILGALQPNAGFKLIPMECFPNITIEILVSAYTFFTSGYCNTDTNAPGNLPARKWEIRRWELVTDQYLFPAEITNIVLARYKAGETLYFHSHSFMLGPTYTVTKNLVPNTISVNLGFDSLKAILLVYVPTDFESYSTCRRQYRLSMNITKLQAKIGMDYYPNISALANGGNLAPLTKNANTQWQRPNAEYVIGLYKTFGKYNDVDGDSFINQVNFAVNQRPWNPDNYKGQTAPDRDGNTYQECFGQRGWPLVHENRCIGKAIYALDLETLNRTQSLLSGINTTSIKPFDISLECVSTDGFQGNALQLLFNWYDFVVAVNTAGCTVVGRV